MVNIKNMSAKFLVSNAVRRVITILGCLIFVFSFIYPFYYAGFVVPGGKAWTNYWSYEYDSHYYASLRGSGSSHQWFFGYWFTSNLSVGPGLPWALISLFTVQVLTVVFGVAFIVSNRRTLSFEPIVLSTAVLLLMTYTAKVISGSLSGNEYSFQYQLGYYLVYPSLAMFIFAFLLNEVAKKMQATTPAKENGNSVPSSLNIKTSMKNF